MFTKITNDALAGFIITDDELLSYVANDYLNGGVQALFTDQQLEHGAHYKEALSLIENDPKRIILEFNLDKGILSDG
tara:strand:- start:232 stop:462 length:231 start_codon:yes stop_codon:yes gene_type:complete